MDDTQKPEKCRVCKKPVRVNIRRGTGICSGNCEDAYRANKASKAKMKAEKAHA